MFHILWQICHFSLQLTVIEILNTSFSLSKISHKMPNWYAYISSWSLQERSFVDYLNLASMDYLEVLQQLYWIP